MNIEPSTKINRLLYNDHQGKLYFSAWMKEQGYSDQLLKQYRESGWLVSLYKGVMYRPGGKLLALGALSSYNEQMNKNFHIAAHSALEIAGFNHFVPMGKPTLMTSYTRGASVPKWMSFEDFDMTMKFFSTEIFPKQNIYKHRVGDFELLVSSPEQAFLEALYLTPSHYTYMDLFYIMEQLTTLRVDVLQELLESIVSVRVKRMFLYMASKANHYWFEELDLDKISLGEGKRHLATGGVYIAEYKITIPKELRDYE